MIRPLPYLLAAAAAVAACGPTSQGNGDDTTGDGGGGGHPDADPSRPDARPPGDAADCGQQTEPIAVENLGDPPDLLIVLDRSGSMTAPIFTIPPNFTPKWSIMRDALNQLASNYQDNIRFGLLEFPTDDDCGVDPATAVKVPIDLGQAPEIAGYFQNRGANGNTPAQLGLQAALAHYMTVPVNPAGRYVLFATDGEPNCSDGDAAAETVAAVTALAQAGIKTYVLGFGGDFTSGTVLDDAALAGQVPRPGGPPHYYAANSAQELAAVLDTISGGIIVPSCSYALASAPPDPDAVTVSVDGAVVPRSTGHTNGWDYYPDAMTITFFGSYCDEIQSGAITEVSFVYGCPGPVVD
ncbi:MAG: VWA domain-containing protein [Kofleriaceae bacterium]|nr:VWA domain-containing protein [Kofleriaceae bacterium]